MSASFFKIIYRFGYVPKSRRKEETDNVHNTKGFLSTDLRDVNAVPTKEKQQQVFQSLKVFYDQCY